MYKRILIALQLFVLLSLATTGCERGDQETVVHIEANASWKIVFDSGGEWTGDGDGEIVVHDDVACFTFYLLECDWGNFITVRVGEQEGTFSSHGSVCGSVEELRRMAAGKHICAGD